MVIKKKIIISIVMMSLISCVSVPKISRNPIDPIPPVILPNNIGNTKNVDMTLTFSSDEWWKMYNDPILNELIILTLESNKALKIAKLNIQKSVENIGMAKSQNSFYVDGDINLQRERVSENGLTPPPYAGSISNFGQINIQSSYTFDLFNKFGSLAVEAEYKTQASVLNSKWVELNIINQVAKVYGYYTYLIEEEKNLKMRESTLKDLEVLEKSNIAIGKGVKETLLPIQQELRNTQSYIKVNNLNQQLAENNLNLISGLKNPERLKTLLSQAKSRPNTAIFNKIKIPNQVSSDVVHNRPDVEYYLMLIKAQESRLKALKADFYPQFSITGQAGLQSIGFNNLLKPGSFLGIIGPSVYLPIFDSGRIKSNYKIAGVDLNIFIEQYNKTVLGAYEDVNNQLLRVKTNWETIKLDDANLKSQTELLTRNGQRLNLGTISKYDYTKAKYSWLTQSLYNSQQHYNLYSQQLDLINSLGGAYGIETN